MPSLSHIKLTTFVLIPTDNGRVLL